MSQVDYWGEIARRWAQIGSPLRPNNEDLKFFQSAVDLSAKPGLKALILGVTQELYRLSWPVSADVRALDHTEAMIEALWPGPRDQAVCGEWTSIPDGLQGMDLILCDGGFHLLAHSLGQVKLVNEVRTALNDGGRFVLRLFSLPEVKEPSEAVLADLLTGKVPSMNHLKMRLAMSLQDSAEEGVALSNIWLALHEAAPDLRNLADRLGWSHGHALAVDSYRDSGNRYHFLTTEQAIGLCTAAGLDLERIDQPEYVLGNRCPTVIFRRSPSYK